MRNARPVRGAVAGLFLLAALATVAWSQGAPTADKKQDEAAAAQKDGATPATQTDANAGTMEQSEKHGHKGPVLRLRATTMNPNLAGVASTTGTLDIVIERWSTEAERGRLQDVLVENGGGDALLSAVQKIKPRVGYVRSPFSTGWDLQYAQEIPLPDGGRRIVVGSDRPMSFWEATNKPPSSEYEFMLADVRLDKNGKGEGRLVPAAAIDYDEDTKTIEVDNYAAQPVRLTQVEVVK